ncbi:histidine phosphatase family protein [Sporosarcina sp. NCCP-2222]|uniref:histidine phosphatase family protein n=1 Tax=Sporosarcina sp. NCCP-2222 TaxID=2935073 RepID=UPI0020875375|nr:histidine phosphatase family protein [Sporosarcina sp. NCCP-2222]GKV56984.1 histidine phosphatase family protein [Sporosarcina sp. NCCP-2222]
MELLFIRHGQGEHTLDIPDSFQIKNPSLTSKGVNQAKLLRNKFLLTEDDVILISPLKRTIETALIWSENVECRKIVTPKVGPRIFPTRPDGKTLPCDEIIDFATLKSEYPDLELDSDATANLWRGGINTLPEHEFDSVARDLSEELRSLKRKRVFIVSHDGTITAYRQFITGGRLSRKDFLDETGSYRLVLD